ncbi:MAG: hypothetical protein HQ503_07195 [Rhodospirillales bacterium]|nr:hypothetical protein [Rhodospirillales bacterium]
MVMLTTTPEQIDIDFARTAIVVVDRQNACVSKGGLFDLAGPDFTRQATISNFETVFGWVSNSEQVIDPMERDTNQ